MISDPLFYAATVPAVILLGLSKGGFSGLGLLGLPLMALVASPLQAAAILLPILMVQDTISVWAYRRAWDRRNVAILVSGSLVGILAAYLLAARVPDAAVTLALGGISIAFALRRLFLEARGQVVAATRSDLPRGLFWGMVMGFTSMISHAGGPPFQIYVMPQRLPRDVFVGTGAVLFAMLNSLKVAPYMALGQLTAANLATSVALFPVAIASTWAGVILVRRVSPDRFYVLVYGLLVLVGAKLVYDGVTGLI